jgi:capsular polysaccharide biosynthesis protein
MKHWLLVAAAFGITLAVTAVLVSRQPWYYEATATLVIRPRADFAEAADDFVRAIDTLNRNAEISTTFSQVANSKTVKQRAVDRLGLSRGESKNLEVSGAAIAGSSVLEITVRGPDPALVSDFANAVSLEATEYMRELYDVFELELLDAAGPPRRPAGPNKTLTLAVGAMFGLMLGIALVFFSEYLQQPVAEVASYNIADPETGLYNDTYFFSRLSQEMSRAENTGHIFSLALLSLNSHQIATGINLPIPASVASMVLLDALEPKMRKEDVLARVGESLFALLLPAMSKEAADGLLQPLEAQVRSTMASRDDRESGATIDTVAIVVTYTSSHIYQSEQDLFDHALSQLSDRAGSIWHEMKSRREKAATRLFFGEAEKASSRSRDLRKKAGR